VFSIDVALAVDPGWSPKVGNRMALKKPPATGEPQLDSILQKAHDAAERCDSQEFELQARAAKDWMRENKKPDLPGDSYLVELRGDIEYCLEELKFGNYIFQIRYDPMGAKEMETAAVKAAQACDEKTYMEQIQKAEAFVANYERRAEKAQDEAREHRVAKRFEEAQKAELAARQHSNSAYTWRAFAEDLKSKKAERFKLCVEKEAPREGGFLLQPGLKPGEEYASRENRAFTGFELAFTPGYSFGSIGTQQENNFDGKSHGKDVQYGRPNLHGDFRAYYGGRGGSGWWRPSLIFGLKGAGTLGSAESGLEADNHPPGGIDSFVDYEINGTLTPFFGLVLADFDCSRINVLAGPRITFAEITGITDESGGGGELERFRNKVVQVGPAVGVEIDVPLPFLRRDNFEAGVRVAGWGEYLPGTDVSGHSSTFPFDYEFETKGAFLGTVRGGFYARFGGYDF
jgi:hypothetical protein